MNSDLNSDSEQCTESKLGQVHKVHTLNPGYEHIAPMPRAQRRVAAHTGPCRGPCRNAHWPGLYKRLTCRSAVLCSLLPCHDTKAAPLPHPPPPPPPPPPLSPFMIQKLYRDIEFMPRVSQRSFTVSQGVVGSVCRCAPTPCRRALGAVSQPLARYIATPDLPPVIIQTIVS